MFIDISEWCFVLCLLGENVCFPELGSFIVLYRQTDCFLFIRSEYIYWAPYINDMIGEIVETVTKESIFKGMTFKLRPKTLELALYLCEAGLVISKVTSVILCVHE